MLISPAYAQTAAGGGDPITGLIVPMVLILIIFYFLLIRPQQKRQKEHQKKIESVRRGDKVLLGGGIFGTVSKVLDDTEVQVEIADGVKVKALKTALADVLTKTEPAPAKEKSGEKSRKGKADKKSAESEGTSGDTSSDTAGDTKEKSE